MADIIIRSSNMTELYESTVYGNVRKKLFDYALQGNWVEAKKLYRKNPWLLLEKITVKGDTALHLAVQDRNEMVVKEMVEILPTNERDQLDVLKLQNDQKNTPLHLAASIGSVSMCECLVSRSNWKDLLSIRNEDGENPIFLAARHGKIEAFLFLQCRASESDILRNNKGETILHCALVGGHFRLAFLIIETYESVVSAHDENGVTPLHLLAKQPTGFKSGTRLSLIDKIVYHCMFVSSMCSQGPEISNGPKERHTLMKFLPATGWENMKRLLSFAAPFIKLCINPSSGAIAANVRMYDEENRLTLDQGPPDRNNENGKRVGMSEHKFPVNYDTLFNIIMLLIKTISIFLGKGRSYLDKIGAKKENHVFSVKILEKILDNGKDKDGWYDSTGTNPLYKDRTISYKVAEGVSGDKPENLEFGKPSEGLGTSAQDVVHILLEEVQRSTDSVHKLLEQAQTNGLLSVDDKSQELITSLKEDSRWEVMQTMCKAINQTSKRLGDELLLVPKKQEEKLETPILIAAEKGIPEIVEKILACFPEAIHDMNTREKNVVLLAVEKRHPHVYNVLLKSVTNLTDTVFGAADDNGNSTLHLAAMFTDPRPWRTPGAALQMQWEVRWFQYVKSTIPSNVFSIYNHKGESPHQIFTDKHKDLVQNGGKWLKNTATSCSVVSTLITTVAFATSVTFPGGNKQDSGLPALANKPEFHLFEISSLIALCFSITATIMFLAILSSRQREKDFAQDLPMKLLAGLTSLFVSILAILVSFCSAHSVVLPKELRSYGLLIYTVTCLPATIFAIAQLPLYIDLTLTTFSTVPRPPLEDNTDD